MRVVLDTNVVVSALLSPEGSPAQVLALVASGQVALLLSDPILLEYRRVLRRAMFRIDADRVAQLLEDLDALAEHVLAAPSGPLLPDPDDTKFLDCARTALADCIVTGNARHFPKKVCRDVTVLSPREFLQLWRETAAGI
jgi:putative PIN family toxin of toxin-antitoxin system